MAAKDFFNSRNPVDKTLLARFGRFVLVRGTFPNANGLPCLYGIFTPGPELAAMTDGIVLRPDELRQLAALLPTMDIRDSTPPAEYQAAIGAREKKKQSLLW